MTDNREKIREALEDVERQFHDYELSENKEEGCRPEKKYRALTLYLDVTGEGVAR